MQHFVKASIVFIIKDGRVDKNCRYYLMYQTQRDVNLMCIGPCIIVIVEE